MTGILTPEMRTLISEQGLGHVATVCPDNTPNLSPKGSLAVWDGDQLVFADLRSPQTIRNLKSNPAIEVNVIDPIRRKGFRFKGQGQVISHGDVFEQAVSTYSKTLARARERIRAVVLIKVQRALPLISPAYDLGLSEAEVMQAWLRRYGRLYGFGQEESTPESADGDSKSRQMVEPELL